MIAFFANRIALALGNFRDWLAGRFGLVNCLCIERVTLGGQAAPGLQVELPAMHGAGQHAVLNFGEALQVGL